jgi:hypothetical protein
MHRMSSRFGSVFLTAAGLLALAAPVLAHHSVTAEFDPSKSFSVSGVITKLEWVNPHVYIYVDVKDDKGGVINYSFEGGPPGNLRRTGILRTMFNVGDAVTVDADVAKDGSKHLGHLRGVHFADGHAIVFGAGSDTENK